MPMTYTIECSPLSEFLNLAIDLWINFLFYIIIYIFLLLFIYYIFEK